MAPRPPGRVAHARRAGLALEHGAAGETRPQHGEGGRGVDCSGTGRALATTTAAAASRRSSRRSVNSTEGFAA
jgi:hypothetical protein